MKPFIIHSDAKEIIQNQLPPKVRSNVCSIVERAYTLTSEAIKHTTILNWELGHLHEGYLRNLAIGYLFQQQIELKQLPLTYTYEYNRNRSHKYLILSYNNVKMTFSQVNSRYDIARPAYFRNKLEMANQGTMIFPDIDDVPSQDQEECYLLLTFSRGGHLPKFVNIGLPHLWRERIDLLQEPRIFDINQEILEEEVIEQENLIEFRNFTKEVEGLGNS
ncbi:hypothetical protein J2Z69_000790 [Paenibacillus shirakamiensis]|uniref:Uncharacterized protein n=1 Tax=Paenibacillus shirakamiensis TaxID=1265935 RepID=A0ABS4JF62_9BACL|nr:hypothetical protein [Paenibacillus shirakamiensis]MBP1999771.1 hypothetical protein [Paenibacillus shirakamiensis]